MNFAAEVRIEAPARYVWPILIDVESWPLWADSFTSLEILSAGKLDAGSVVAIKQPRLARSVWTVSHLAAGRSFAWVSRRAGMTATANHELIDQGDHCVFRQTIAFDGRLGRFIGWMARNITTKYMSAEAQGLKRISEVSFGALPRPPEGSPQ